MEIIREKGREINIFGETYYLKPTLGALAKIEERCGDLENLKLSYRTIPDIMEIMVGEYCDSHPEATRITADEFRDNLSSYQCGELMKFVFSCLNENSDPNA